MQKVNCDGTKWIQQTDLDLESSWIYEPEYYHGHVRVTTSLSRDSLAKQIMHKTTGSANMTSEAPGGKVVQISLFLSCEL